MKAFIKPFLWGMGVGAVLLLIIIFSTGWVTTTSSAKAKAEEKVREALLNRLVPICIEQFLKDPKKEERLEELKNVDYWKRGEFVEKQGWATMPYEKEPDRAVAEECARRIILEYGK